MTEKNKQKIKNRQQRNFWGFNPATRIKANQKKYNRNSRKQKREEGKLSD